ncbi:hypothetical protein AVEN_71598-1, partial [Araneus ventricosus]
NDLVDDLKKELSLSAEYNGKKGQDHFLQGALTTNFVNGRATFANVNIPFQNFPRWGHRSSGQQAQACDMTSAGREFSRDLRKQEKMDGAPPGGAWSGFHM